KAPREASSATSTNRASPDRIALRTASVPVTTLFARMARPNNCNSLSIVFDPADHFFHLGIHFIVHFDLQRPVQGLSLLGQLETLHTGAQVRSPPRLLSRRIQQDLMLRRSEEHTSELQSRENIVCRLLLDYTLHPPIYPSFPTRRSSDLRFRPCRSLLPSGHTLHRPL